MILKSNVILSEVNTDQKHFDISTDTNFKRTQFFLHVGYMLKHETCKMQKQKHSFKTLTLN